MSVSLLTNGSLDGLLQQQRGDLHRTCVRLLGELLEPFQRRRRKADESLFIPRRVGRASAAFRDAEPRGDFGGQLDGPEIAASGHNLAASLRPQVLRDSVHVEWCTHDLFLRKISE